VSATHPVEAKGRIEISGVHDRGLDPERLDRCAELRADHNDSSQSLPPHHGKDGAKDADGAEEIGGEVSASVMLDQ
jgi:hypothetical protein